ncbi:MAG: Arm DNA-binding domain-containing protein, partial [Candidatus Adiutrix sp.]|nr:Arm DNA-binding domain-containing protein [Candidatus Adiutrix sp.]
MNKDSNPASRRKKNGHGLTDVEIRALKPTSGAKGELVRKRYPDGNGLFLVVGPTGSKWWEYRFAFEGKKTGIGLGTYPVITLAVAREKHLAARRELAEGRNPAATGKKALLGAAKEKAASEAAEASAGALTFASLAESWLESRDKNGIKRVEETRGRLKNHVFPTLGNVPIKDISAAKVLEAILAIKAKGLEEMAKRCLSCIRQIFNYAIIREWADR